MRTVQLFWMTGPFAGRQVRLEPGAPCTFGRDPSATIPIDWDKHISRLHFQIERSGDKWFAADIGSSNGTYLNESRIQKGMLADGDQIVAAATYITVRDGDKVTPYEHVLEVLRSGPCPLYAVIDAARDKQILPLLTKSGEPFESLLEGEKGKELKAVAPYLVQLAEKSTLLQTLVYAGWGKWWGIYLNSREPFAAVRKQLRRSLLMRLESDPSTTVFFRFYDPRVCGVWLPCCTPQETAEFLGGIEGIAMEDETPGVVIRFARTAEGLRRVEFRHQEPPSHPIQEKQ